MRRVGALPHQKGNPNQGLDNFMGIIYKSLRIVMKTYKRSLFELGKGVAIALFWGLRPILSPGYLPAQV
jgi:hypothetical protein